MPRYSLSSENNRSKFGVGRILIEILVIVIGIYLAFIMNSWGDKNKVRELEKKYLIELLNEAKINKTELDLDQEVRRKQVIILSEFIASAPQFTNIDSLKIAIKALFDVRFYSPSKAVYQDLISSGNLNTLRSDSLRHKLFQYNQYLSKAPITEGTDRKFVEEQIEPYFKGRQILSWLEPYQDEPSISISDQQYGRIVRNLLKDRAFIDLNYLRISKIKDVIYFETPMGWRLREIINIINEELTKFDD
jgi:Family of unknown function (DUF6090)